MNERIESVDLSENGTGSLRDVIDGAFGFGAKDADAGMQENRNIGIATDRWLPVFFSRPVQHAEFCGAVAELAARFGKPFVVFAPTGVSLDASTLTMIGNKAAFYGLQSGVGRPPAKESFARFEPRLLEAESGSGGHRYALRRDGDIWEITFDGRTAYCTNEIGLQYVAYLLLTNPPSEPIYGATLAARVFGYAEIPERSLGKEDAASQRTIKAEAEELAAVLRSDDASGSAKDEARQRLEELAAMLKHIGRRPETNAEKTVRAMRKAIQRLHKNLAGRKDENGKPHPVFVPFAEHILKYVLNPSARYGGRNARVKAGVAGCFTYEPPAGVVWAE